MTSTDADPGRGDIAVIRRVAASRRKRATDLKEAVTMIASMLPANASWTGETAEVFRADASLRVRELTEAQRRYASHARELERYANGVESIRNRARPLHGVISDGLSRLDRFVHTIADQDIPTIPGFESLTNAASLVQKTFTEGAWWLMRQRFPPVEDFISGIEQAISRLEQLEQERQQLDSACVTALRVLVYSGPDVGPRAGSRGNPTLFKQFLNDPSALERLASQRPPDPAGVAALWATLSLAERLALANTYPKLVGNLQGVPYTDRSTANNVQLTRDLVATRKIVAANPDDGSAKARLAGLEAIKAALGKGDKEQPEGSGRYLISYEMANRFPLRNQPLAAISYGNLDTADYATYLIPGMDNTAAKSMGDLGGQAQAIRDAQRSLLGPDAKIAVVAWLGYVTPDVNSVQHNELASAGAARLAAELEGYGAVQAQAGHETHLGVVAHSYGSTTAMLALQQNHGVDSLVVFGSAGQVPGTTVDIPKDNFTIIRGERDVLAPTGIVLSHREDPTWTGQGNSHFSHKETYVDKNGHVVELKPAIGSARGLGHDGYLDRGTSSLQDIAAGGLGIKAEDYR